MNPKSFALLAPLLFVSLSDADAKAAKVDVCHMTGSGSWVVINISEKAVDAHLRHGDVLAGAWYPDSDGDGWGDEGSAPLECPDAGYVDNADDCGDGGAASGPGLEEILDGFDNDCDGDVDEGLGCPCFDAEYLDDMSYGLSTEAHSWIVQAGGDTEVTSLRAYYWFFNEVDAQWQAPAVGADVFRAAGDGTPYCETWSQTYLGAPDHGWGDDAISSAEAISEESFLLCEDVLYEWIEENGTTYYAW
jgi:hypothetical protein